MKMQHSNVQNETNASILKDSLSDGYMARSIVPSTSTENSESAKSDGLVKKITIRDTSVRQISVPYNIEYERRRARNLAANGHKFTVPKTDKSID